MERKQKSVVIWLISGMLMILIMIIIGGITRLTHSGLSMVDWKPLMGILPPLNEAQWIESFEKYQQFPEFKEVNYLMTLADYKSIFFWEYIHRLWGRLMGLAFLIPFIIFQAKGYFKSKGLLKQILFIFIGGASVAGLGWFMVLSGLEERPAVSHIRLAIHLMAASLLLTFIYSVVLKLKFPSASKLNPNHWSKLLIGLTLIQMTYGAFVAGLKAGLIHNTYPLMSGQFIHDNVFSLEPFWENLINHRDGVQFIHRTLAIVLVLVFIYLYRKYKADISIQTKQSLQIAGTILTVQFILGILTLLLHVPVFLGVVHQLVAVLFLLSLMRVRYFSIRPSLTE